MRERRWPWVVTSVLLLVAAVAAAWSTYLYWLPCRGALLSGSLVRGYRYSHDFSDACLRRMDAGMPFSYRVEPAEYTPWAAEWGILAMALAGTAWLVLALGMRWSLRTKAVAVLPGLATLALAAAWAAAGANTDPGGHDNVSVWLLMAPETAALVALVAIWGWQPAVHGLRFVRVLIVAWGSTVFGIVHMIAEYMVMSTFSQANWDVPPLTGSVTVLTLIVAAALNLLLTFHPSPPVNDNTKLSEAARPPQ